MRNFWENFLFSAWNLEILVASALVYVAAVLIGFLLPQPGEVHLWAVIALICLLHSLTGIKVVSEKEIGVKILFGRMSEQLDSGPTFAPWPIRLVVATVNAIQVDFGTIEDSQQEKVRKSETSDSWFLDPEPVRITWGGIGTANPPATTEEKQHYANHPLAQNLTTDPHLFFQFTISDLRALRRQTGDVETAIERIRDTCITALSQMAGTTFPGRAIQQIDELSTKIFEKVQELTVDPESEAFKTNPEETWGVNIRQVRIKDLGLPRKVNEAIGVRSASIAVADGEATRVRLEADANLHKTEQQASGTVATAEAERRKLALEGIGRAEALTAVADAVAKPGGKDVLQAQTAQEGLRHGRAVIIPANAGILGDLLSVVAVAKETGNSTPPPPKN